MRGHLVSPACVYVGETELKLPVRESEHLASSAKRRAQAVEIICEEERERERDSSFRDQHKVPKLESYILK